MNVIQESKILSCTITVPKDSVYKHSKKGYVLVEVVRNALQKKGHEFYRRFNNNFYSGKYETEFILGTTWIQVGKPARKEVSLVLDIVVED